MKIKESARSPQYGTVFIYDENGKQVEIEKVLKVRLTDDQRGEFTIEKILKIVPDLQKQNMLLNEGLKTLSEQNKKQSEQIETLKQVVLALSNKIKTLKRGI